MDSIKAEKQRITPKLDSGKLPSLEEEIDWEAAYSDIDATRAEKAEKQRITPKLDSGKLPSLEEEIDWEAAYSDIDATRARRKILS
jgi:hypothetical protein